MSRRYKGGVLSATAATTTTTAASGVWTLPQQFQAQGAGTWPAPSLYDTVYATAGTYSWVAPTGITSVSVVAVGGGRRGGGGLGYKNNYAVTPGNSYTVVVGSATFSAATDSYFVSTAVVKGGAGGYPCGGTYTGDGGGNGGAGGNSGQGGGGAGGYAGASGLSARLAA